MLNGNIYRKAIVLGGENPGFPAGSPFNQCLFEVNNSTENSPRTPSIQARGAFQRPLHRAALASEMQPPSWVKVSHGETLRIPSTMI